MKIIELLIGPSYPIKNSGENTIENRMKEIKNLNSNIIILFLKKENLEIKEIIDKIFNIFSNRIIRSLLVLLCGFIYLNKIKVNFRDVDIIIANGYYSAVFIFPFLCFNRKKTVYCPHTQVAPNFFDAILLDFFDAIVFLSKYNRKQLILKNKKLASKSYTIYNFLRFPKRNFLLKKRKTRFFNCLFVGRAVEVKRPFLFLKGVHKAYKINKKISATMIISDGTLKQEIINETKNIKNNTNFQINLYLNLEHSKVLNYYNICDCFVFSSDSNEGFGNVLLEAMYYGLPIICTNHRKFREFLGKAALYFNDENDLAKKIFYLSKNKKLYKKYSKASLERYKKLYEPSIGAKKWINLFKRLYAKNR